MGSFLAFAHRHRRLAAALFLLLTAAGVTVSIIAP